MRRSHSSFDVSDAIVKAEALSPRPPPPEPPTQENAGVPLVAFENQSVRPTAISRGESEAAQRRAQARLQLPPDLSGIVGVSPKCDRLIEWLRSDPHTTSVLLVDAEGLPIAAESSRDDALLGATAGVAAAMRNLALASPGSLSREFESHVGDGPILSLIGLLVGAKLYIVGLSHTESLAELDVARIRAAFIRALTGLDQAPVLSPNSDRGSSV